MTDSNRKLFEVRSARNAEFFRSEQPWAAISISSSGQFPVLSEANRVGLLRLVFEDVTQRGTPKSFTSDQAAEILDFVADVWNRIETLLIHCDIGMSRSPAVAAALCRIYYRDDGRWFELEFPNRLVYDELLAAHDRWLQQRTV
jgi:predicted protein tyrosine phosphatase